MEFRPCIDIHNGKVKQIVGGSLKDSGDQAQENFVSEQDAAFYAALYQKNKLKGGHIILLNSYDSPYYEETRKQALAALQAYPGGLQVGGGITPENAGDYLNAGASHVIVTSYVFREGRIDYDRLERLVYAVGRERLVLDVSCKRVGEKYLVVTDRWQKLTEEIVNEALLEKAVSILRGISDPCGGCGREGPGDRTGSGKGPRRLHRESRHICGWRPFHGRSAPSEGIGTKPDECDHRKCTGPVRRQYEVGRRTEDMQRGSLMNIKMPQANNVCGILYAVVL